MNNTLFFDWLKHFSSIIAKKPRRKVVLLLDNSSTHETARSIPKLSNVEIMLLSPTTTAELHPMVAKTNACLNRGYRKWQYEKVIDNFITNVCNIYAVHQLVAMKFIKAVWQELSAIVIQNC